MMKNALLSLLAAWFLTAAASASEFVPAKIVDVQRMSEMKADTLARAFGGSQSAVTQDDYLLFVFDTADRRVTARTFSTGGGVVWAMNHPEAFLVGSEVSVAFGKRGMLEVQVAGKKLKLNIMRMEIINSDTGD